IVPSLAPTLVKSAISSSEVINGEAPIVNGFVIISKILTSGLKTSESHTNGIAAIGKIIWLQRSPIFFGKISEKIIAKKVNIAENTPTPKFEKRLAA